MNNENRHPNHLHTRTYSPQQNINHRLATLLVILATFQQKIEILRVKLSGHPNFSPQLYYKQIDRMEKGYIDTQDIITFIKKSKPTFNIDHRYLKSLFVKLNNNDKQNQPKDRLTYFGYLNIIKPYFDNKLARDLLLRDSIAIGTEIDLVAKKLLEDLICTLYACVAEHERAKQLMILGDLQQGGSHQGTLYNIYQILDIIKNNAALSQQTSIPHILTNQILSVPQSQSNIRSQVSISQHIQTNRTSKQRLSYQSILDIFYNFICNTSQYQINREDMKYLLAYLMCHEHMITQQKYLTQLFMPVTSKIQISGIGSNIRVKTRDNPNRNYFKEIQIQSQKILPSQMNFLSYVHPNSISRQTFQLRKKSQNLITNKSARQNPQIKIHTANNSHKQIIDQQPRTLVNGNNSTIKTPILQKFLRQSKVLKNMSRYQPYQINQQQSGQQSAFVQQSNYLHVPPQTDNKNIKISNRNNNSLKYITEMNNLDHKPKQITKDFNIQQVLTNSNLHRSQYYQNLSLRANIKDQVFQQSERKHMPRNQSGILSQFMKR